VTGLCADLLQKLRYSFRSPSCGQGRTQKRKEDREMRKKKGKRQRRKGRGSCTLRDFQKSVPLVNIININTTNLVQTEVCKH